MYLRKVFLKAKPQKILNVRLVENILVQLQEKLYKNTRKRSSWQKKRSQMWWVWKCFATTSNLKQHKQTRITGVKSVKRKQFCQKADLQKYTQYVHFRCQSPKFEFKTGGTWHRVRQWTLIMIKYDFFYSTYSFSLSMQ